MGLLLYSINELPASLRRQLVVTAVIVLSVLLALEIKWALRAAERAQVVIELQYSEEFDYWDPPIGKRPAPNHVESVERRVIGVLSYAVSYTTDQFGNRVTPEPEMAAGGGCMLFFGGSDTFGDGVADDQTMPYIVGRLTNEKVFNMGVSGYGPNHILALIEFDRLPKPLGCRPELALFQTHPEHVKRSAGLGQYSTWGPRYVLAADGTVVYTGQFGSDQKASAAPSLWEQLIGKSYIYHEYFVYRDRISDPDIQLYLAIVAAAQRQLQEKFPGIEFFVLNSDTSSRSYAEKMDRLLPTVVDNYIRMTEAIPGLRDDQRIYRLPLDTHPNPLAHRMMAEYLVAEFVRRGLVKNSPATTVTAPLTATP